MEGRRRGGVGGGEGGGGGGGGGEGVEGGEWRGGGGRGGKIWGREANMVVVSVMGVGLAVRAGGLVRVKRKVGEVRREGDWEGGASLSGWLN